MNTLFYGNGECFLEGSIRGIYIEYEGNIEITDKTPDTFVLNARNNNILIFPIGEGNLSQLFDYVGEFVIQKVIACDPFGEKARINIKPIIDYANSIETNFDSMDVLTDKLGKTFVKNYKVNKTTMDVNTINNLHTDSLKCDVYTKNRILYTGDCHIHIETSKLMTGKEHQEDSEELYTKRFKNGKYVQGVFSTGQGGSSLFVNKYKSKVNRINEDNKTEQSVGANTDSSSGGSY